MSEAETRAMADAELAQAISSINFAKPSRWAGIYPGLAALGQGYPCKPAKPRKRRYRPRGTWLKLRGRK